MRISRYLIVVVFLSAGLACSFAAEQGTEKRDLIDKLRVLRENKAATISEYDENLHKVDREAEERMAVIKTEYRKAREECIKSKRAKTVQLRKDFEDKLKPMLREEAQLVEMVGRDASEDFVKTKTERAREKR